MACPSQLQSARAPTHWDTARQRSGSHMDMDMHFAGPAQVSEMSMGSDACSFLLATTSIVGGGYQLRGLLGQDLTERGDALVEPVVA
jgi:hypothetical protein